MLNCQFDTNSTPSTIGWQTATIGPVLPVAMLVKDRASWWKMSVFGSQLQSVKGAGFGQGLPPTGLMILVHGERRFWFGFRYLWQA